MVMRRSRWCGILCSLLICSIVLMGLDLAFLGGKVSASTREKLAAPPKEGMSVSVSTNTNANGSLRFGLKLSGCEYCKKATIDVSLNKNGINYTQGHHGAANYVNPTGGGRGNQAHSVSASSITITTTDAQFLRGEKEVVFTVSVNTDAVVSSAVITSVEEYTDTASMTLPGDGKSNTAITPSQIKEE